MFISKKRYEELIALEKDRSTLVDRCNELMCENRGLREQLDSIHAMFHEESKESLKRYRVELYLKAGSPFDSIVYPKISASDEMSAVEKTTNLASRDFDQWFHPKMVICAQAKELE